MPVAAPGGVAALLASFLVAAAVSTATVHVAARYVLGDVALRDAALVGPVVPAVVLLASSLSPLAVLGLAPLAVLGLSLLADVVAVHFVYRVCYEDAAMVAAVHYAVSVLLALAVARVVRLVAAAPA